MDLTHGFDAEACDVKRYLGNTHQGLGYLSTHSCFLNFISPIHVRGTEGTRATY